MPTIDLGYHSRKPDPKKTYYQSIYQDRRWKEIVNIKKHSDPLCERCLLKGVVRQMESVHHRIPFMTGQTPEEIEHLAFSLNNAESLCNPCHKEADRIVDNFNNNS